jgi:hypothetical protein
MIGIDISPTACRKANALARRTLINFIVAADVSRLKLSPLE